MSAYTCTEVNEERLFCLCSNVQLHVAQNFIHAELLTLDHSRENNSTTEQASNFRGGSRPLLVQPTRYITKFWQTTPDGQFSLRRSHIRSTRQFIEMTKTLTSSSRQLPSTSSDVLANHCLTASSPTLHLDNQDRQGLPLEEVH